MSEENKDTPTKDARKEIIVSGFSDTIAPLVEHDLNLTVKPDSLAVLQSVLSVSQKEFVLSLRAKSDP